MRASPAEIRAFVERPRAPVVARRRAYWAARKRRLGLAEVLRVAEELRRQARLVDPSWPTDEDREADQESHARVAALLARVPRPAPTPRTTRPGRGAGRVRPAEPELELERDALADVLAMIEAALDRSDLRPLLTSLAPASRRAR